MQHVFVVPHCNLGTVKPVPRAFSSDGGKGSIKPPWAHLVLPVLCTLEDVGVGLEVGDGLKYGIIGVDRIVDGGLVEGNPDGGGVGEVANRVDAVAACRDDADGVDRRRRRAGSGEAGAGLDVDAVEYQERKGGWEAERCPRGGGGRARADALGRGAVDVSRGGADGREAGVPWPGMLRTLVDAGTYEAAVRRARWASERGGQVTGSMPGRGAP